MKVFAEAFAALFPAMRQRRNERLMKEEAVRKAEERKKKDEARLKNEFPWVSNSSAAPTDPKRRATWARWRLVKMATEEDVFKSIQHLLASHEPVPGRRCRTERQAR